MVALGRRVRRRSEAEAASSAGEASNLLASRTRTFKCGSVEIMERRRSERRLVPVALALDVLAVVLFAALGRRSHDEGSGVLDVLETAAPFLIALAVGWLVVRATRLEPTCVAAGVVLWAVTVAGGLILRRALWDRGTAASFIVVAALVLGLLLVAWRGAFSFARGRSGIRSASPPTGAER